jgi:hypothetical protein
VKNSITRSSSERALRSLAIILSIALFVSAHRVPLAWESSLPSATTTQETSQIPPDQLDSLVAPIALYPDPLLSQTLVASTYPLEIMQLQQWLSRNSNLRDKALADAVSKQPWDPSIQAMAALPDVVKRLADDIQWTTDLGNAFLAQQANVMEAVQRMRQKAQGTGALQSNQQQTVETRVVEEKSVIVVEQADPQVVYVPSYAPEYVYGPPVYPYPPIYYPSYPAGVVAASAISFGVGWAMGAAWGGGWGWGCGWGGNNININNNNNFVRNTNIGNIGNRTNISGNRGGRNTWQHNPQHRGGAPYRDQATANRFGGTARGDSLANRQTSARQQLKRQGGNLGSTRPGSGRDYSRPGSGSDFSRANGVRDRSRGDSISDRSRTNDFSDRSRAKGVGERSRTDSRTDRSGTNSIPDRSNRTGYGDRGSTGSFSGRSSGSDRVGSRDIGRSSSSGSRSAFGGGSGGFSGKSARQSSSRGASSFGGSRGGSRGGGRRR